MVDVLTPAQRRLNMSRIRGTNTKPEKLLRSALHATGLRFRLHRRDLPGRPDIVFVRQNAVVFVHGCFWHDHGCSYSKLPATREAFWKAKLAGNKLRDQRAIQDLRNAGWRVIVVWECALRGPARPPLAGICARVRKFLDGGRGLLEIQGVKPAPKRVPAACWRDERVQ
jgi:DNA mismatch endonuclease (patch repair protein)